MTYPTVHHGAANVLTPDAVNIYWTGHGDTVFVVPSASQSTVGQRIILKLFSHAHSRVRVQLHEDDGGAFVWDGTTGGDYLNMELHPNGLWLVFDHFETVILRLNKDNHQSIPGGLRRKVKSWHVIEDTAKLGYPNQLTTPYPARMDLSWHMVPGKVRSQSGLAAEVTVNSMGLEPEYSQLVSPNAHGCSYSPITLIGFILGAGATVGLYARNLESDRSNHVDARSEAWIRLRWRL